MVSKKHSYPVKGFILLRKINSLLVRHYPDTQDESYHFTVNRTLERYSFDPTLEENFRNSISIRNKICHFRNISEREYKILSELYMEFKEKHLPKKIEKETFTNHRKERGKKDRMLDDYLSGYD